MPDVVRHVDEVLELLSVVNGDQRIWDVAKTWNRKEEPNMGMAMLDEIEERGVARGIVEGEEKTWVTSVRNIMKSMQLTAQQAVEAVAVPMKFRQKVLDQVAGV